MRDIIISIRLQQWIKNLFLFAALIFSGHLFVLDDVILTVVGFVLFSLASSAVYLFNDCTDIERDRLHPIKSQRPLPSGRLSVRTALVVATVLALISLIGAHLLGQAFGTVVGLYLILNIFYSLKLKELVILDVMAIAAGFVLRVVAGATLIGVPTSEWLIICTMLLSLFLGFSKRRVELVSLDELANPHRSVLAHYSAQFLDQMTGIVTAATVMSYAVYTISEETVAKFGTSDLIYTVPFVLYGIFRYLYLVHKREEGGDPTKTILTDVPSIVNLVLWISAAGWIIYAR
jgi:4-hydroxybenzoate polyprenyltransferase